MKLLALGLPVLGKAGDRRGRKPRLGAEELLLAPGGSPRWRARAGTRSGKTSVTFGERRM